MDLITEQKLERRARILEGARRLIAERGYGGLTMRDLAAHCRVSVPTLYNQFGSKDALLSAAVETHFAGTLAAARARSDLQGAERLIAIVTLCADEMVRLSRYHRALLRAFLGGRETSLQVSLASELAAELEVGLQEMRARRQLAEWVFPRVLAERITAACIGASVTWLVGQYDDARMRAAMLHDAASMTLGAARGGARRRLEASVRDAQAVLEPELEQTSEAATG